VGKSTFARTSAHLMGWEYLSTDSFARHPGRPWRDQGEVPELVKTYYLSRKLEVLLEEVVSHYRRIVWPIAQAVVQARIENPYDSCLVLEGSAILPDCVFESRLDEVWSIWLTAKPDLITQRIHESSRYTERSRTDQALIDIFLRRSLAFNDGIIESVSRLGQPFTDVTVPGSLERLSQQCAHFAKD
jgi:hypothetical protein